MSYLNSPKRDIEPTGHLFIGLFRHINGVGGWGLKEGCNFNIISMIILMRYLAKVFGGFSMTFL
jgi:hypothetical protein